MKNAAASHTHNQGHAQLPKDHAQHHQQAGTLTQNNMQKIQWVQRKKPELPVNMHLLWEESWKGSAFGDPVIPSLT